MGVLPEEFMNSFVGICLTVAVWAAQVISTRMTAAKVDENRLSTLSLLFTDSWFDGPRLAGDPMSRERKPLTAGSVQNVLKRSF
jgi:hypothetical protein